MKKDGKVKVQQSALLDDEIDAVMSSDSLAMLEESKHAEALVGFLS